MPMVVGRDGGMRSATMKGTFDVGYEVVYAAAEVKADE